MADMPPASGHCGQAGVMSSEPSAGQPFYPGSTPAQPEGKSLSHPQPGEVCPWHGGGVMCRYCTHTHSDAPSNARYGTGCRHFDCREAHRRHAAASRESRAR